MSEMSWCRLAPVFPRVRHENGAFPADLSHALGTVDPVSCPIRPRDPPVLSREKVGTERCHAPVLVPPTTLAGRRTFEQTRVVSIRVGHPHSAQGQFWRISVGMGVSTTTTQPDDGRLSAPSLSELFWCVRILSTPKFLCARSVGYVVGRITPRERTCADFVGRSAIFFVGVFLCLLVNPQLLAIPIAQPPTSAGASRRRRRERSSLRRGPARPTLASCVTRQAERLGENKFFLGNSFGDSRSTLRSSDGTGACAAGPSLNRCLSAPNTSHQSRRPRFSALRKTTRVSGVMKKIRHRKLCFLTSSSHH